MDPPNGDIVSFVQRRFGELADPDKAAPMAAYMKTDMPFYGIQKPERVPILRELKKKFPPSGQREYETNVRALWALPHREEKYAAIEYAIMWPAFIQPASLPLYERMVRNGAWWDFVDGVAADLVGSTLLHERDTVRPLMNRWIEDSDIWVRRSAILAHLRHKDRTDWDQLADQCLHCAHEREFFIRKAIGWALREYSKTNPRAVRGFLVKHQAKLAGLSYREGAKHLVRVGLMG
jgi:3-methyladenine DNA glycosylase AlkD